MKTWPLRHNGEANKGQCCLVTFVSWGELQLPPTPRASHTSREAEQRAARVEVVPAQCWSCRRGRNIVCTLLQRANQHGGIRFPSAKCSDATPEHWILLLSFFLPSRLEGKDVPAQHAAEAHAQWVPRQQVSRSGISFPQAGVSAVALQAQARYCKSQNNHLKTLLLRLELPLASPTGVIPFCSNSAESLHSGHFSTASPLRCCQPVLRSGRSGGQDLTHCLVILPAEDVQWHKLII